MAKKSQTHLSRRERQIMDIIYEKGRASAIDVMNNLPDPPSYSAVRALLRVLETKGHLTHNKEGTRYLYAPTRPRHTAGRSALKNVLQTFYGGSVEKAVAVLLDVADTKGSDEELNRLAELIEQTRREGH
ncbi:MAG: BlaI/MecI/CopY family transcriptional regulator [bacterium]